uniref:Wntless-like transmembrane domain-containing protein n=1 Tax=Anopheles darlingi TaxID=43151 RepID=A0A2M4D8S7_ANODA
MRLKFLTLLMLIVVSFTLIVTLQHFGFDTLKDNFIAQLYTSYKSSAQFMCFYGLLNFYLYAMAYGYSPSGPAVHGTYPPKAIDRKQSNTTLHFCPQNP